MYHQSDETLEAMVHRLGREREKQLRKIDIQEDLRQKEKFARLQAERRRLKRASNKKNARRNSKKANRK